MTLSTDLQIGYDPVNQVGTTVLVDQSGNGRDATLSNAPTFVATGLNFVNENNQFASNAQNDDWWGETATYHIRFLVRERNTFAWIFGNHVSNTNGAELFLDGAGRPAYGSWSNHVAFSTAIDLDTFVNVALTVQQTSDTIATVRMYINGTFAAERTNSELDRNNRPSTLTLGKQRIGDNRTALMLDGVIASFAAWSRILTDTEITTLNTNHLAWADTGPATKYFDGTAWVGKPLKYWTGSAWVAKPLKRWNGTAWV